MWEAIWWALASAGWLQIMSQQIGPRIRTPEPGYNGINGSVTGWKVHLVGGNLAGMGNVADFVILKIVSLN